MEANPYYHNSYIDGIRINGGNLKLGSEDVLSIYDGNKLIYEKVDEIPKDYAQKGYTTKIGEGHTLELDIWYKFYSGSTLVNSSVPFFIALNPIYSYSFTPGISKTGDRRYINLTYAKHKGIYIVTFVKFITMAFDFELINKTTVRYCNSIVNVDHIITED